MDYQQFRIDRNTESRDRQYFIDRLGKVHKYKGDLTHEIISMHYEIAHEIMPSLLHPKDVLMRLGWCMVGSICYNNPIIDKEPTQSQINELDRLGILQYLLIKDSNMYKKYVL